MEFDVNVTTLSDNGRVEKKIEMLHITIRDMSLCKSSLWYSNCREEGNTKDTCKHQTFQVIQMEHFCEICREISPHLSKDYPYNLRNQKKRWCSIHE